MVVEVLLSSLSAAFALSFGATQVRNVGAMAFCGAQKQSSAIQLVSLGQQMPKSCEKQQSDREIESVPVKSGSAKILGGIESLVAEIVALVDAQIAAATASAAKIKYQCDEPCLKKVTPRRRIVTYPDGYVENWLPPSTGRACTTEHFDKEWTASRLFSLELPKASYLECKQKLESKVQDWVKSVLKGSGKANVQGFAEERTFNQLCPDPCSNHTTQVFTYNLIPMGCQATVEILLHCSRPRLQPGLFSMKNVVEGSYQFRRSCELPK